MPGLTAFVFEQLRNDREERYGAAYSNGLDRGETTGSPVRV
jgi:hypothetical protein